MDSFLAENGVRINPEFELATSDMIVQFALRSLGIGNVVRDFAAEYLESGRLFELRFNKMIPRRHFCVVTGKGNLLSAAARRLLELIQTEEYRKEQEIKGKICMNLSANFLGLGNAATPLGLSAMKAMAEKNSGDSPTKGMILFVVINTASIQLLPINMAAIRSSCGSMEPFGILPEIWLTSAVSLLVCVLFCKLAERGPLWNR